MADEILKKQVRGRGRDFWGKQMMLGANKLGSKRERFLAYLQSTYGYTNDKAVAELERLFKQFHEMNESLGIHDVRPD
jgi:hypothetical protein